MCNCTPEVWSFGPSRNDGGESLPYPTAFASLIACQIFAGVSGVLSCLMPSSLSASITQLNTPLTPAKVWQAIRDAKMAV